MSLVENPTILIATPKLSLGREIRGSLKRFGYQALPPVSTEEECLREIFKSKPGCIIIDLNLNGDTGGIGVADKIRANFGIPVIYFAHEADIRILQLLKNPEPFEYIVRPINEKNLYSSVEITLYREEMEKKLRESEGLYRTIFENTGNATIIIEDDTTISLVNREFEQLSGYRRDEVEGKRSWTEFVSREDLDRMMEYHRTRRINPTAAPRNYEFRFLDRFGSLKDIYMTTDVIPGTQKSVKSFMNITEQKRLESEIIRVSDLERQQIGNDLHDGLGPHLVGIKFMTNLLKQKLDARHLDDEAKTMEEINDLISQAITRTRQLVKGLAPVEVDVAGLLVALDELAAKVRNLYGINCTFVHPKTIRIRDNNTAHHLFLIVQEAVNNAIKHSNAQNIGITMNAGGETLSIGVTDDGVGIEKLLDKSRGMGINIMKYRARIINATLHFGQNGSGGTSITCVLKNVKEQPKAHPVSLRAGIQE